MNHKIINNSVFVLLSIILLFACKKPNPVEPDPHEEITSVRIDFIKMDGILESTDTQTVWFDIEGNPDVDSLSLMADATYKLLITPFDEEESLVPEIVAEGDEHQFFLFGTPATVIADYSYVDIDVDGHGIGTQGLMTMGSTNGAIKILLRHALDKSSPDASVYNSPTYMNAGGEDDLNISFNVKL